MEPQHLFVYVQQPTKPPHMPRARCILMHIIARQRLSTASFMMCSGTPHGQTALHQCIINSMACSISLGSCTGATFYSRVGSAACGCSCSLRRQTANSRDIQWRSMPFACPGFECLGGWPLLHPRLVQSRFMLPGTC